MLIILAAMVRHAFMETGRPSEHDGKVVRTKLLIPILFYTFFNVTRNVTLRVYFTKKLNCGHCELKIGTG